MKKHGLLLLGILALDGWMTGCQQDRVPLNTEPDLRTYQPVEYHLCPAPEEGWVGDVMPFAEGDRLELYYLYDTDHNGQSAHPIHRFATQDLSRYQDEGLVLPCGAFGQPDLNIGTGSILKGVDGLYHCFYTGNNPTMGALGQGKECVMHAVSPDKQTWTKIPEDTFYAEDGYSRDDFRDPQVFWSPQEQCYWMLLAAREETLGGVVVKYTSEDLSDWTFCGPLYAPQTHYMLECPDLFEMGGRYYLVYSWDCVTYYAVADQPNGPFSAPEDNVLDGQNFAFYAAKTVLFQGQRYLCGWVGRNPRQQDSGEYDWAGNLLIHQLVQKPDGSLGVCAPEGVLKTFGRELPLQARCTEGDTALKEGVYHLDGTGDTPAVVDFGMREPSFLLECDLTLEGEGSAGFAFGPVDQPCSQYAGLALDAARDCLRYEGTALAELAEREPANSTRLVLEPGRTYHIRLVAENEILLLYVEDTKVLSCRSFRSVDGARMGIFAAGTRASFANLRLSAPDGAGQ